MPVALTVPLKPQAIWLRISLHVTSRASALFSTTVDSSEFLGQTCRLCQFNHKETVKFLTTRPHY